MNILLVRPRPHKNTVNLQSFMICEPLELETLAAELEAQGHNTVIADLLIEKRSLKYFLKNSGCSVAAFTAYLPHAGIVKQYAAQVKLYNPNIITVVGGVHAEVVPEDFASPDIDFIVNSNGAKSLTLIAGLLSGGKAKAQITETVKGVYAPDRKKEAISFSEHAALPLRDKTLKYSHKYNYIFHDKCAIIKTSFGCNHNCSFCFCTQITGNRFHLRDLDSVMAELKSIKEANVFIVDDNFLCSTARVREFCEKLDAENIKKNYILFGRADFISRNPGEMLLLKAHGLQGVFIGIESFEQEELGAFNKKTTVAENITAMEFLDKNEIDIYSGIVTGPSWTRKDFDRMISFMNRFKAPMPNIQPLTPIPGTPLFAAEQENLILPRGKYELWDMAHLAFKPVNLSVRAYYYNIFRAYLKTTASAKTRKYILRKYGRKVYRRTRRGAVKIGWQYFKLIVKGK